MTNDGLLDGFTMRLDHEPTPIVLVRMRNRLIGPLKVMRADVGGVRDQNPEIGFPKSMAEMHAIPVSAVSGQTGHLVTRLRVWPSDQMMGPEEGREIQIEAITGLLPERVRADLTPISLYSSDEIVQFVVRQISVRRERREAKVKFTERLTSAEMPEGIVERITGILSKLDDAAPSVKALFDAVATDPRHEARIDTAISRRVEEAVESKAAQINSRVQERVQALSKTQERLLEEIDCKRAELRMMESNATEEIARKQRESEEEIDRRLRELSELEATVREDLQEVADKLEEGRCSIIREFLTLRPLLGTVESGDSMRKERAEAPAEWNIAAPRRLPAEGELSEMDFLQRFENHAKQSGFDYEAEVYRAFHLSAKKDAMILLSGPSGTGKSSLPRLCAEALAGEEGAEDFLSVDVAPNWMGAEDFLGYLDVQDDRFVPAAGGVFTFLARAASEDREAGSSSAMHVLWLDEIDLARPEHYISNVMQALAQTPPHRTISIFDPTIFRLGDSTAHFASLPRGPNLVFVGTMKLDETVTTLSPRFLDRANVIEILAPRQVPALSRTQMLDGDIKGRRRHPTSSRRGTAGYHRPVTPGISGVLRRFG